MSIRGACSAVKISRTVYCYQPDTSRDQPVIEALLALVDQYPSRGFGKLFTMLRRQKYTWNHKRVHRIYCGLKLNMRRKGKRRLPNRHPDPLSVPDSINQCWSADFMSDALWYGQRFRTFNLVDDYNREGLAVEVDLSLPARRIVRVLDRVASERGYPAKLRVDNGPELISVHMADWAETHGVELEFIQPGKPMQNGFIERFNRTYREEVLDMYVFNSMSEVRNITENWLLDYNEIRPHESLGDLPPVEYALSCST
jgi:putative transposase